MKSCSMPTDAELERIKEQFLVGTRIELVNMEDPYTELKPGAEGTVTRVDPLGDLEVDWDNGSRLKIILGEDQIRKL